MNFYRLSTRAHRFTVPYGFTSWRAYWIELAVFGSAFSIGMACVAVASLIGAPPV
jgi:hypothetical protein